MPTIVFDNRDSRRINPNPSERTLTLVSSESLSSAGNRGQETSGDQSHQPRLEGDSYTGLGGGEGSAEDRV